MKNFFRFMVVALMLGGAVNASPHTLVNNTLPVAATVNGQTISAGGFLKTPGIGFTGDCTISAPGYTTITQPLNVGTYDIRSNDGKTLSIYQWGT